MIGEGLAKEKSMTQKASDHDLLPKSYSIPLFAIDMH